MAVSFVMTIRHPSCHSDCEGCQAIALFVYLYTIQVPEYRRPPSIPIDHAINCSAFFILAASVALLFCLGCILI